MKGGAMASRWVVILVGLAVWTLAAVPAAADSVSIGVSTPDVSFNLSVNPKRPALVAVPGLPVYHVPTVHHDSFFYSGHYYVHHQGVWFTSVRHSGPWVAVHHVPPPILAVPVKYYKVPPGHARKHEPWKDRDRGKHGKGKGKHGKND
jgi:hypothetical protein